MVAILWRIISWPLRFIWQRCRRDDVIHLGGKALKKFWILHLKKHSCLVLSAVCFALGERIPFEYFRSRVESIRGILRDHFVHQLQDRFRVVLQGERVKISKSLFKSSKLSKLSINS